MQWRKTYETGHEMIDNEHKEIFSLTEKLFNAEFSGKSEKIESVIDFLTDYVVTHFKHEESLIDSTNYPNGDEHKAQHRAFEQTVAELRGKLLDEGKTIRMSMKVSEVIVDWLVAHVLGSDKLLADWCKSKQS